MLLSVASTCARLSKPKTCLQATGLQGFQLLCFTHLCQLAAADYVDVKGIQVPLCASHHTPCSSDLPRAMEDLVTEHSNATQSFRGAGYPDIPGRCSSNAHTVQGPSQPDQHHTDTAGCAIRVPETRAQLRDGWEINQQVSITGRPAQHESEPTGCRPLMWSKVRIVFTLA